MSKIMGIFSKEPLIWFHYILLTGIVWVYYSMFLKPATCMAIDCLNFGKEIIILFLIISISDQLIHYILGVD